MATIDIRIRSLSQLLNGLDPAPLPKRTLEPGAESYILGCAGKHRLTESLRLLLHLPESLRSHAPALAVAIPEHFRRAHAQGERAFRRRLRIGGVALAIALVVLAGSVALRSLLRDADGGAVVRGLEEGLLILGWVAMWRPVEILLFEHWESHRDHDLLERLSSIPVECVFLPDAVWEPLPDLPPTVERT